jgi:hypothetical protein
MAITQVRHLRAYLPVEGVYFHSPSRLYQIALLETIRKLREFSPCGTSLHAGAFLLHHRFNHL